MNILIEPCPNKVHINDRDYTIRSDFRTGIRFALLMEKDDNLSDIHKIMKAFHLFYRKIPTDKNKAIEKILWFYNCGLSTEDHHDVKSHNSNERILSYEQDQFMIYAAFIQYYQINLYDIDYLHWWEFKQLFNELPDEARIKKVMLYRSIHINSKMSKEEKQFYADMKSIYQIRSRRNEQQKVRSFASILAGGMNIPNEFK